MVDYGTPGVYVKEVPSGPRPIGAVGTSTAAFLGEAPQAGANRGKAVAINNWTEFVAEFVGNATTGTDLSSAVHGFYANGGGRCYVVNLGANGSLEGTSTDAGGLQSIEAIDEIAMVAAPGRTTLADYSALLAHCEAEDRQDRVAILDAPSGLGRQDIERLTRVAGGADPDDGLRPPNSDGGYGAFYFPWFSMRCPITGQQVLAPPSGHVAGIWARTDSRRGVHKAPGNEVVIGALKLEYVVSRTEQALLNPRGVNCLRFFPDAGNLLWGVRTLAPEASEWRYINVRRLVNMIKESIQDGTRWVVMEPNSEDLWSQIRRDVGAFLTRVWQDGALVGASADEAFFVKCDAETNPPEIRNAGQVVTLIGIAPVKPAEFVIFKLMQSDRASSIQTVGG